MNNLKFKLTSLIFIFFIAHSVWAINDNIAIKVGTEKLTYKELNYSFRNQLISNGDIDSILFAKKKVMIAKTLHLDTISDYLSLSQSFEANYISGLVKDDLGENSVDEVKWEFKQIFLPIAQHESQYNIQKKRIKLDSIYSSLVKHPALFDSYIDLYSFDKEVSVASREDVLEETEGVFKTLKVNCFSTPFFTPEGIHIIKLISVKKYPLIYSNRSTIVSRLKKRFRYKLYTRGAQEYLDKGNSNNPIFRYKNLDYSLADISVADFSKSYGKRIALKSAINQKILEKYLSDLQNSSNLAYEQNQFKDRWLIQRLEKLFSSKIKYSENDLEKYFKKNKSTYRWDKPHFKGAVILAKNKRIYKEVKRILKHEPIDKWEWFINKVFNSGSEPLVQLKVGFFKQGDNSLIDRVVFKKGEKYKNQQFPYIKYYGKKMKKGPKDYHYVLNQLEKDYKLHLFMKMMNEISADYDIFVDKYVLKTVNTH